MVDETELCVAAVPRASIRTSKTLQHSHTALWQNVSQNTRRRFLRHWYAIIIRPPDIVVGRLTFYQRSFFLSFFLSFLPSNLWARWTELNNIPPHGRKYKSVIWKCMSKIWGIPSPTNRGLKTTFWRFHNLSPKLTAYIYETKYGIHLSGQVRCKLQGVCYIVWKRPELWFTNGYKLDRSFYPPSVNSAFQFIARVRWRRSANETQPHFGKRRTVSRANKLL